MRRANVRNLPQKTRLRVEGELEGQIKPIKSCLERFGAVQVFHEKNTPNTVFFAVEHTANPIDVLNSVLQFKHKGVDNVVFA